jgi:hypothetical protein
MATYLPYTTFNALLMTVLNPLLGENARATNTALAERVPGHYAFVNSYRATGSTTSKITLGNASPPAAPGSSPVAVLLVRVYETADPAKDLPVSSRLNFSRDGATLYVFEPAGLTSNTMYDLTFLVLETG